MKVVEAFKARPLREQTDIKIYYQYKDEFLAQLQKNRGDILETTGPLLEVFGGLKQI